MAISNNIMAYSTVSLINAAGSIAANDKRLSICLKPNGFSFSLIAANTLYMVGEAEGTPSGTLTDVANDIKSYFGSLGIVSIDLKEAELVVPVATFTWVPDEVYTAVDDRNYLTLTGAEIGFEHVYTCHSDILGAQLVFASVDSLITPFKIALPGIKVCCQYNKTVNTQLATQCGDGNLALLNLRDGYADLTAYRKGKLELCRTVASANVDQLLFQTLETVKLFTLESDTFCLLLCGEADRDIYATLRPYFASVALYTGRKLTFATDEFRSLHTYRHALTLC